MAGETEDDCIDSKVDKLTDSVSAMHKKLDRLLAILDARENKKQKDRIRIKQKRDEASAGEARQAGKIVVDRLEGTMHTDVRLPYKLWAYIMLEFQDAREFLRWLMNEYLESYHCIRDSRRRMIVRKGNHWKFYQKGCGTEKLVTPADMFGGQTMKWDSMLNMMCMRWCHVHVRPILEHVCNLARLEFVHERHLSWNGKEANAECGEPMPLECRWWAKGTRYREVLHASLGPYGDGWIRTAKGSMRVDFDENVLKRRELQVIIGDIARSLHDGVINRASHVAWVEQNKLQPQIDAGIEAHRIGAKEEAHKNFLKQLHAHKDRAVVADGFRMGVQMAVAAREEHDMQKAIQASLTVCSSDSGACADDEKVSS